MSDVNWTQEGDTDQWFAKGAAVILKVGPSSTRFGSWDWLCHIRGHADASRHGTINTLDDAKFCALSCAREWWLSQVETGWFR